MDVLGCRLAAGELARIPGPLTAAPAAIRHALQLTSAQLTSAGAAAAIPADHPKPPRLTRDHPGSPEVTQARPRSPRLARDHRNTRAQGSPCTRARSRLVCTDPRDGSPRSVHPPAWRCGMTRTERTNGRPANFAATEAPVRLEAAFRGRDGDPNALGSHRPHKLSSRRALPAPLGGRRSGGCRRGRRSGRGRRSRRRR